MEGFKHMENKPGRYILQERWGGRREAEERSNEKNIYDKNRIG